MAKIHPLVWLIVGVLVASVSYKLGRSMLIFFVIGLVMTLVGIIKVLTMYSKKKKPKPKQPFPHPRIHPAHRGKTNLYPCPYCNAKLKEVLYFCPYCGVRLRKSS